MIEAADSSLGYDRNIKLPRYAAAGIAEEWLIDLTSGTVERYSNPHNGLYRLVARARPGELLVSTVLPALTIPIETILR